MTDDSAAPPESPQIGGAVVCEGYMMKKKSSRGAIRRSIGLKWVTRYFILYPDGRLVYFKTKPSNPADRDAGTTVCLSIADCAVDRVATSDLAGDRGLVPNSFYLTTLTGNKTLLVTQGPVEHKRWMKTFRSFGTTMSKEIARTVAPNPPSTAAPQAVESVESAKSNRDGPPIPISIGGDTSHQGGSHHGDSVIEEVDEAAQNLMSTAAATNEAVVAAETEEVNEAKRREVEIESSQQAVPPETATSEEKQAEVIQKTPSETLEELKRQISDFHKREADYGELQPSESQELDKLQRQISEFAKQNVGEVDRMAEEEVPEPQIPTENEMIEEIDSIKNEMIEEIDSITKSLPHSKVTEVAAAPVALDRMDSESVEDVTDRVETSPKPSKAKMAGVGVKEAGDSEEEDDSPAEGGGTVFQRIGTVVEPTEDTSPTDLENDPEAKPGSVLSKPNGHPEVTEEGVEAPTMEEVEAMAAEDSTEKYAVNILARVFAHGNGIEDFHATVDQKRCLYGLFATSHDELKSDGTGKKDDGKDKPLSAFSVECTGPSSSPDESNQFTKMLPEIHAYCRMHLTLRSATGDRPLSYGPDLKDRMVEVLSPEKEEDTLGALPDEQSFISKGSKDRTPVMSMGRGVNTMNLSAADAEDSMTRLSKAEGTAYKHVIEVEGADNAPTGEDVLAIVREQMGFPYNWVLFNPSKKELVIKDAGSGGVLEITKLLQNDYDDCVLFGLVRMSFSGEFGRRQFWAGIEWKGENCYSVKAMRQFNDSIGPMSRLIGDRSFTLSNVSAAEMTPELFVGRLKRSCNVGDIDLTVELMRNAHKEEQEAIKKFWRDIERKVRERESAAERKRKEAEMKEIERGRRVTIRMHEERKGRWDRMNATEILQDLGKDGMAGWVLLEF